MEDVVLVDLISGHPYVCWFDMVIYFFVVSWFGHHLGVFFPKSLFPDEVPLLVAHTIIPRFSPIIIRG